MEASKIQAQQLQDCFDNIEWECGVAGLLDEVVKYCLMRAELTCPLGCTVIKKEYKEKAKMISELADKIRRREL